MASKKLELIKGNRPRLGKDGKIKSKLEDRTCKCGNYKNYKSNSCAECYSKARKKSIPKEKEVINQIRKYGYSKTGKNYGVSDNAVRKWVKSYNLDPKKIKKK